jgi:uncharacterized protein
MAHRVAVIADTHLPRRRPLPPACIEAMRAADLIVHAGDIADEEALEAIGRLGPPVVAVRGNVDEPALRRRLPETAELTLAGLRIGVIHDAGADRGRARRMARRFPDAGLVIFGHSHIPMDRAVPGAPRLLNPGSPTDRRRQARCSMAVVHLPEGGDGPRIEFLAVDDPPGPLGADLVRH